MYVKGYLKRPATQIGLPEILGVKAYCSLTLHHKAFFPKQWLLAADTNYSYKKQFFFLRVLSPFSRGF
jgi:hypothetical protein